MENLAGIQNCDETIMRELKLAAIPYIKTERNDTDVPYTVIGALGDGNVAEKFIFERQPSYWLARGPVPLPVAAILNQNKDARAESVSAGGDYTPPGEGATEGDINQFRIPTLEGLKVFVQTLHAHAIVNLH